MYFLALSHAPPPVVIEIATKSPVTIEPTRMPPMSCAAVSPLRILNTASNTTTIGTPTGINAGTIISLSAAAVTIDTIVA